MTPKVVTDTVRVDELRAYLAAHGLQVVRGGWRWGDRHPYVITGPAKPVEAKSQEETEAESNEPE